MVPRLKEKYAKEVVPLMMQKFAYKNRMQVPRFLKIVVNMGGGDSLLNIKLLDAQQFQTQWSGNSGVKRVR